SYISDCACDTSLWICMKPQDVVKQKGGDNCGVFVCTWPYIVASQERIAITDEDATDFRQVIKLEIISPREEQISIHLRNERKGLVCLSQRKMSGGQRLAVPRVELRYCIPSTR